MMMWQCSSLVTLAHKVNKTHVFVVSPALFKTGNRIILDGLPQGAVHQLKRQATSPLLKIQTLFLCLQRMLL